MKKERYNNKKTLILLTVVGILLILSGTSYALWQLTFTQTETNTITTGCFKINFMDKNPISLQETLPITDKDGRALAPYEFTITNICNERASYVVNLETLTTSENALQDDYVKASLQKAGNYVFEAKLEGYYENANKVIDEAKTAYRLHQGVLEANDEVTYNLRLWVDAETPTSSEAMNKLFESKITVTTSYLAPASMKNMMGEMTIQNHTVSENETWTENTKYTQNGKYKVNKVVFQNTLSAYTSAAEVVDFSLAEDESVLGYYVPDEDSDTYTLYIQASGKIKVNPNAAYYGFISNGNVIDETSNGHGNRSVIEGLENLDTSSVTSMKNMFYMNNNTLLDLGIFDTSNVTDMSFMFYECKNLEALNINGLNTSNVTNMSYMFYNCEKITHLDTVGFNTSNVTDMSFMFFGCGITDLNIGHFNTSNVTNMSYMFNSCGALTRLNISGFNTAKVTNMERMFNGNPTLTTVDYGTNFIYANDATITEMYEGSNQVNKPTDPSWTGKI